MSVIEDHEELMEAIERSYSRMRPREIVDFISDEGVRQKYAIMICQDFDIPDTGSYSEDDLYDLLRIVRLKEDSYGPDQKPVMRKKIVQYCFDAIREAMDADPVAEEQVDLQDEPTAKREAVERMDIRQEIADASESPDRFIGAPPDLTLFPDVERTSFDIPACYPKLLTPPPAEEADDGLFLSWLSGNPVARNTFAFGLVDINEAGYDKMINLEPEYTSSPKTFMNNSGQTVRLKAGPSPYFQEDPAKILACMQETIGETSISDLAILKAFRDAVASCLKEAWPDNANILGANGSTLRIGPDLMPALRQSWSLEEGWLKEFGGSLDGHQQNVLGTPHPDGEMKPGLLFRRAVYIHLATGEQMPDALLGSALDLRLAMAVRGQDPDDIPHIVQDFDRKTIADCAAPLSEYRIAKKQVEEPAI